MSSTDPTPLKKLSWSNLKAEISRLTHMDHLNLETLKSEVLKLKNEMQNLDWQAMIAPVAQKQIKNAEIRYRAAMKSLSSAQKQIDREFNRLYRQIRSSKNVAESKLKTVKKIALVQKKKIEKVSKNVRKKLSTASISKRASGKKSRSLSKKTSIPRAAKSRSSSASTKS